MKPFEQISINHFKPVLYENTALHQRYDQIEGFIKNNFTAEFHGLLAKPFVGNDTINWYTELPGNFKPLDSFTSAQRKDLLLLYHSLLSDIHQYAQSLQLAFQEDKRVWGDLLEKVFSSDNNIVYSDGQSIVLLWGWHFNNREENHIAPELLSAYRRPSQTPTEIPSAESSVQTTIPDQESVHSVSSNSTPFLTHSIIPQEKKLIVRSNKKQNSRDRFINNYWWIFLLLAALIFFLYYFLFSGKYHWGEDSGGSGRLSEIDRQLKLIIPKDPYQRLPIDTSKIIHDDDSVGKVISNRVNVALKNKTQSFPQMAIALKQSFPDSAFQIIYYDTVTSRLQFQFPEDQRDSIKTAIRSKLNSYELLIWDESIFTSSKITNDPCFSSPEQSWYLKAMRAPEAWDITQGDTSVVIAIVDDGFDLNHPDLKKKLFNPYNVINRNATVFANENLRHGTHVAGLALANSDNGVGVSGIAPKCGFMPVQIATDGEIFTSSDIIDGILYAIKHNADVINLSLGKQLSDELHNYSESAQKDLAKSISKDEEFFWKELFDYADRSNVTIVVAAGNQDLVVGIDAMQRSDRVIKVSAVNSKLKKAEFSNYGSMVTVCAPGEHIYNCVPGSHFEYYDGTSMASPLVAGLVGLMKSVNPNLKNDQIIQILKNTGLKGITGEVGPLVQADKAVKMARGH